MIADYYVVRKRVLDPDELFKRGGEYEFSGGFNWRAVVALAVGIIVALIGLVVPALRSLYQYAWFVGFGVSFVVYLLVMPRRHVSR
jgi:NCS1 family nucleobase:cation symporter-1